MKLKKIKLSYLVTCFLLTCLYACNKENNNFEPAGGLLPTNYITVKDNSFSPATLTVANGSSITFLNSTTTGHSIMSDDSVTIPSVLIAPDSSYFFKPDTATTSPVPIYIRYHCIEHPSARGTIILNQ